MHCDCIIRSAYCSKRYGKHDIIAILLWIFYAVRGLIVTDILSSIRSAHKVALLALFVTLCGVPTWAYGDVAIEDGLDAPVILFGASGYQMEKDEAPSYDILPTDLNAAGTDSELVFDDDSETAERELAMLARVNSLATLQELRTDPLILRRRWTLPCPARSTKRLGVRPMRQK